MSSVATTAEIANLMEATDDRVSEGSLERIPVAMRGVQGWPGAGLGVRQRLQAAQGLDDRGTVGNAVAGRTPMTFAVKPSAGLSIRPTSCTRWAS